jgi:hypothetical protein
MNTQFNALQAAVDGQLGFEFDPIRFDGKSGLWMLDGVQFTEARRVILVVTTGKHKGIAFDAEGGIADETAAVRYTAAPPPQKYDDTGDLKPSTQVTGVIDDESKRLVTVSMLTWAGRAAFARIINAFLARRMQQFPICELTSKLKPNDPHHNFMPVITPVDWIPCNAFPDLAPPVDAIEGPRTDALPTGDRKPKDYGARREENLQQRHIGRAMYQSGKPPREEVPPIEENDRADAIDEDVEF